MKKKAKALGLVSLISLIALSSGSAYAKKEAKQSKEKTKNPAGEVREDSDEISGNRQDVTERLIQGNSYLKKTEAAKTRCGPESNLHDQSEGEAATLLRQLAELMTDAKSIVENENEIKKLIKQYEELRPLDDDLFADNATRTLASLLNSNSDGSFLNLNKRAKVLASLAVTDKLSSADKKKLLRREKDYVSKGLKRMRLLLDQVRGLIQNGEPENYISSAERGLDSKVHTIRHLQIEQEKLENDMKNANTTESQGMQKRLTEIKKQISKNSQDGQKLLAHISKRIEAMRSSQDATSADKLTAVQKKFFTRLEEYKRSANEKTEKQYTVFAPEDRNPQQKVFHIPELSDKTSEKGLNQFFYEWAPSTASKDKIDHISGNYGKAIHVFAPSTTMELMNKGTGKFDSKYGRGLENGRFGDLKGKKLEEKILDTAVSENAKSGKWLITAKKGEVDELWRKIGTAVRDGKIGPATKVLIPDNPSSEDFTIVVYTSDFTDREDLTRTKKALESVGIKKKLRYKPDALTIVGIEKRNEKEYGIKSEFSAKEILEKAKSAKKRQAKVNNE